MSVAVLYGVVGAQVFVKTFKSRQQFPGRSDAVVSAIVEELETAERISKVQTLIGHPNIVSVLKVPRGARIRVPRYCVPVSLGASLGTPSDGEAVVQGRRAGGVTLPLRTPQPTPTVNNEGQPTWAPAAPGKCFGPLWIGAQSPPPPPICPIPPPHNALPNAVPQANQQQHEARTVNLQGQRRAQDDYQCFLRCRRLCPA